KSFPNAIGVIEAIIRAPEENISDSVKASLIEEMKSFNSVLINSDDEHKKLWWVYFILTNNQLKSEIDIKGFYKTDSLFLKSFQKRDQKFFNDLEIPVLFKNPVEDK